LSVFAVFEIVLFVRIDDFGGSKGSRGGLLGGFGVGDTDFDDALLSRESAETAFSTLGIDAAGSVIGIGSFYTVSCANSISVPRLSSLPILIERIHLLYLHYWDLTWTPLPNLGQLWKP
jgi:hypothetical protein